MLAAIIEIEIRHVVSGNNTRRQITVIAYNVAARIDPTFEPQRRSLNGIWEVYRSKPVLAEQKDMRLTVAVLVGTNDIAAIVDPPRIAARDGAGGTGEVDRREVAASTPQKAMLIILEKACLWDSGAITSHDLAATVNPQCVCECRVTRKIDRTQRACA